MLQWSAHLLAQCPIVLRLSQAVLWLQYLPTWVLTLQPCALSVNMPGPMSCLLAIATIHSTCPWGQWTQGSWVTMSQPCTAVTQQPGRGNGKPVNETFVTASSLALR